MTLDSKPRNVGGPAALPGMMTAASGAVSAPGKHTLVEQLPMVQRAGAAAPGQAGQASVDVQAAAAHGTSGASGALPHLSAIQRSFGSHDVSHIQAYVGGAAAEGATAMGATAFATGSRVAFARQPDLHTAAHEAAHVVQQRAGVHLKGGVGEVGDTYEQHADAVADRVVRGEFAGDLLDKIGAPIRGGSAQAGGAGAPVQRVASAELKESYRQTVYAREAEAFELKLGYALSTYPAALQGATLLTDRLKKIVDHSERGKTLDLGDTATGKVAPERAHEIFKDGNLRERMAAVYSAMVNGLGGAIAEVAEDPRPELAGVVDADRVKQEKAKGEAEGKANWRAFERSQLVTGPHNDRQKPKDRSKNLDAFFQSREVPTANKVVARGEAPLSTRELEAIFPSETQEVANTEAAVWNTLDEAARQDRYLQRVGDLPLTSGGPNSWVGGEHTYEPGPRLREEGASKGMRMLAGISGSTDMYLHLAEYFGLSVADKAKVRLAALGTMIPARDHSFHEIMTASTAYGLDYTAGPNGAGYRAFLPFTSDQQLRQLAGVPALPGAYLEGKPSDRVDAEISDPNLALVARVPGKGELPSPTLLSTLAPSLSTYQGILRLVDSYHAAPPEARFGIADDIVRAVDQWMIAHPAGVAKNDRKRAPLAELRARAAQAGTSALGDLGGDALRDRLTGADEGVEEPTGADLTLMAFAGTARGLTGQGAAAFDRLVRAVDLAVQRAQAPGAPAIADPLPAPAQSPLFAELQRSPDFLDLVAALEHERATRWLTYAMRKAAGVLVKITDNSDITSMQKEETVFERVRSNYVDGVDISTEDVTHPRQGRYRLPGGEAGMREKLQAARMLTPDELDAVYGYTNTEYQQFNDKSVSAERRAALISAIGKLPKVPAPLYRGDYASVPQPNTTRSSTVFTSTSRSLEDSFISARPVAHVYVSSKGAADIEGFSKKTWEREALFGPTSFRCVAVVNKARRDKRNDSLDATFDPATNTLAGHHGTPTAADQRRLGNRAVPLSLNVGFEDGDAAKNAQVAKWYEEKFSDKTWVFWEEV